MASDSLWRFIVIAEDRMGAENATLLADRVMMSMPSDKGIPKELDHLRHWTGVEEHNRSPHFRRSRLKTNVRRVGSTKCSTVVTKANRPLPTLGRRD